MALTSTRMSPSTMWSSLGSRLKRFRRRRLDLQAKVSLLLVAVIVPTFVVLTVAENKFSQPLLEEEMRQIGVNSGKTIAAEIVSSRLLTLSNPTPEVEDRIQELLYSQPDLVRIDVLARDPKTKQVRIVGSNVEDDPGSPPPALSLTESVTSEFKIDDQGIKTWDINVPIESHSRDPRGPRRLLGTVHVVVSTSLVDRFVGTLWQTTATAAAFSVMLLLLILSYLLRKAIANDRLLRVTETQNLELAEQLHEAQRQLMNTEKLAVMGQLTASFAHEIGTPLNAIGGHLSLMKDELAPAGAPPVQERLEIINSQVAKIEQIVKNFLQSTAKPTSQRQLVDMNRLADQTLGIVRPRLEALRVDVQRNFDRKMGPVRAVPLDLEQILLNLVNNSLDSLQEKARARENSRLSLEVSTRLEQEGPAEWAVLSVYDTGVGIKKSDIQNVLKPFFTTKRPGEGTGLGLTICQQLAHKYGGRLEIDSKESAWTQVTLKIPYQAKE